MRKSSFTPEQIAFALKQADSGIPVAEIVRKLEISEQTSYLREMVNDAGFKTKDEARNSLVSYIELYYNSIRKHSALGYIALREYEELNS